MHVEIQGSRDRFRVVAVTREPGEAPLRDGSRGWGANPDGELWYRRLKTLRAGDYPPLGRELVKTRMQSDGHLYGTESTQYIRPPARQWRRGEGWMIYDPGYAVRLAYEAFNAGEEVRLSAEPVAEAPRESHRAPTRPVCAKCGKDHHPTCPVTGGRAATTTVYRP
jgi:hypothetical protein